MELHLYPEEEKWPQLLFSYQLLKKNKNEDIVCVENNSPKPVFIPLRGFYSSFSSHLALFLSSAIILSFGVNYSPWNCPPSTATCWHPDTNAKKNQKKPSDTLHCRQIDFQGGFYRGFWGADTSSFCLLILLPYPNEPCIIHHCSAGCTQAAWMAGRAELKGFWIFWM